LVVWSPRRDMAGSPFEKEATTEPFETGLPQSSLSWTVRLDGHPAGTLKLFTQPAFRDHEPRRRASEADPARLDHECDIHGRQYAVHSDDSASGGGETMVIESDADACPLGPSAVTVTANVPVLVGTPEIVVEDTPASWIKSPGGRPLALHTSRTEELVPIPAL
jgi:hypothetical protein